LALSLNAQEIIKSEDIKAENGVYYKKESNSLFTGKLATFYSNGQIESYVYVKNGKKTGKIELFFDSGRNLAVLYEDENHINFGKIKSWNEDGTISFKGKFIDGKLYKKGRKEAFTGTITSKYDNGKIYEAAEYKNGYWHGKQKRWSRNDEIMFECIFENNVLLDCPIYQKK